MNKREIAACERRIKRINAAIRVRNKHVLSQPGLKLFKFTIGPYQFLKDEWGTPWIHLFVVAETMKEAIRLKKKQDATCPDSIRSRRHKWFVIPFLPGEVILA